MKIAVAGIVFVVLALGTVVAQQGAEGDVNRGKYIVERLAMCDQCHTSRDERGRLQTSRMLQGAPFPFSSPYPDQHWANTAPRIAGLPQYTREQGIRLLTTGISRTGKYLNAPMPQYRMNQEDARDVVLYLQSMH